MIDTASEQLLTLQQAADRIPVSRGGRRCHPATIWRWIKSRKLEGIRLGDRWLTSVEALQRYAERQTLAVLGETAPELPSDRMTAAHKRRQNRAEREAAAICT